MSQFFKIDLQTHPKTSLIYFGPTKTLISPSQKPSWGPRLLEIPLWSNLWLPLTRQDPKTKPKTNQQSSKSPETPTKAPISPYHLKNYSPGLLSALQYPWKPPVILFWPPGIPIEQARPPRSLITLKTTQQPSKSPMALTKTPIPLYYFTKGSLFLPKWMNFRKNFRRGEGGSFPI